MTIKSSNVLDSLRRHLKWLQPQVHDEILAGFRKDGLIEDNDTAVRASAAPQRIQSIQACRESVESARLFKQVSATAARMGYPLPATGYVDEHALNAAIRGHSVEERMLLKSQLSDPRIRLIP